jgi:hypothetical protein
VSVLFHTFELFTFIAFLSGRAETSVCTEQGVSCPGHEANHWPSSSVKVEKQRNNSSTSPMHINSIPRDSCTCTFGPKNRCDICGFHGCDVKNFFWDVTPFGLVDRYHRFEGTCYLCIQGKREDRWRWKPRFLSNIGVSLHDDAASHSTRQYSCLNKQAVKNFVEMGLRIRS